MRFPLAYRLLLQWCGHTPLQSLEYDCRLDSLDYSWDSARELLAANHATLEPDGFVIGEWQGYNFFYLLLGSENPPVKWCSIVSDTGPELEYHDEGRFTDWLIERIKLVLPLRRFSWEINVPAIRSELDRIAQLANHT